MLYTQYYAIFYIAALGLVALIRARWIDIWSTSIKTNINYDEIGQIFLNLALAGLAFLPWMIILKNQMHTLSGTYWMQLTGVGMLPRVLFENLYMPPANAVMQIPLMLVCFAWLIGALIYAVLHRPNNLGSVLWLAFLPFGLAVLVSLVWQPVLHYRPLIGISPFLYILLAWPVEGLFVKLNHYTYVWFNRRAALVCAIFIIPLILVPDASMYVYTRENKTSSATKALTYIQAHWQPGDIIYDYTDDSWVNTTPFENHPSYKSPECGLVLGALSPATRQAIGMQIVPLTSLSYQRAWLLWSDSSEEPMCAFGQLTSQGLDPHKPLITLDSDEYYFDGLWLLEK
jgi:hypothetical protein